MATSISHSPTETFALGQAWGRSVQKGTVIGLCGDLGAGKTQLVKGLAHGLGIEARVVSPTFALVNVYETGRLPLVHLDLYRLESPEAVLAAGLEEYLAPKGVTVIEWAERWFRDKATFQSLARPQEPDRAAVALGEQHRVFRWVSIETIDELTRRICYEDLGA